MATSNQIELRKAKETERSNRAKEAIDINKLNETVRNNNLINKVNIQKNELQRLANNQLNERELLNIKSKLDLAYDQLNEQARSNDLKVDIERYQQEMNKSINDAKNKNAIWTSLIQAVGRAAGSFMKILPINTTGISLTNATNYFEKNPVQAVNLLTGNVTNLDYFDDPRLKQYASGDQLDQARQEAGERQSSDDKYYDLEKQIQWYQNELDKSKKKVDKQDYPKFQYTAKENRYSRQKYKEIDEIPEDNSQSTGPGVNFNPPISNLNVPSITNTNENPVKSGDTQYSRHGTTSGGTNYHVSGGIKSKGVIYAS